MQLYRRPDAAGMEISPKMRKVLDSMFNGDFSRNKLSNVVRAALDGISFGLWKRLCRIVTGKILFRETRRHLILCKERNDTSEELEGGLCTLGATHNKRCGS